MYHATQLRKRKYRLAERADREYLARLRAKQGQQLWGTAMSRFKWFWSNVNYPLEDVRRSARPWADLARVWLFSLVVAPLRFAFAVIGAVLLAGTCSFLGWARWPAPMGASRALIRGVCRTLLWLAGCTCVTTSGALDPRCRVVVTNHVSALDGAALLAALGPLGFVVRAESGNVFVRTMGEYLRFVFVDRASAQSRAGCAGAIARRVTQRDPGRRVPPLVIFAEGTTGYGTEILPFRHGAFRPLAPVQPVALRLVPRGTSHNTCSGDSPSAPSTFATLWLTLCLPCYEFYVDVLPPVKPLAGDTAASFAERVRGIVAAHLGVPSAER